MAMTYLSLRTTGLDSSTAALETRPHARTRVVRVILFSAAGFLRQIDVIAVSLDFVSRAVQRV